MDLLKPDDRPAVLGYFNAVSSTGFIIGPLISGFLADVDPTLHLSLLTGTTVYSINFFCIFFLLPPSEGDLLRRTHKSSEKSKKARHWFIDCNLVFKGFHWRAMKHIIVIQFLIILSVMMFRYDFPVFMEENFAMSNTGIGKIMSYSGITSTIGSAFCGILSRYSTDFSKHCVYYLILLSVSLSLVMLSSSIFHILASLLLLSLATSYLRICIPNLMLERGRGNERGVILGFNYSVTSTCRMLAPSFVGVAQEFGSRTCGYSAVCLSLVGMVICIAGPIRDRIS